MAAIHVVVFHELIPAMDQGGNIRLNRVLAALCQSPDIQVTVFVREEFEGTKSLTVLKKVLPVFSISDVSDLPTRLKNFQVIITGMWFWRNMQNQSDLSLPHLIETMLRESILYALHIIITDDVHHIRFTEVSGGVCKLCDQIMLWETELWENPRVFKVFISKEDMQVALSSSNMSPNSAAVLPFTSESITARKAWRRKTRRRRTFDCKLTYFGAAHPANVMALRKLYEGASDAVVEFDARIPKGTCILQVAGDDRWNYLLSSLDATPLADLGITVRVLGFLDSVEELLRQSTLVILPVNVGGSGVSTKVISCVELGIPFISTTEGNRGFPCDEECRKMFFFSTMSELLDEALLRVRDSDYLSKSKEKLQEIMESFRPAHIVHDILMPLLKNSTTNGFALGEPYAAQKSHKTCETCATSMCLSVCQITVGTDDFIDRTVKLSVFASIKGSEGELQFLSGYIENVFHQDFVPHWELVLSSTDSRCLNQIWHEINKLQQPKNLRIKLVLLRFDPGLYETWDYIVSEHASAETLQNWNVDDRKHTSALTFKFEALSKQDTAKLVSSPVLVSTKPNEVWNSAIHNDATKTWFGLFEGYYGLFSMFEHGKAMEVLSLNMPHNSPMYKRELHRKYGKFSTHWYTPPLRQDMAPTCSDFSFWVTPLQQGELYYHLNFPIELYYLRLDSHNRAGGASESQECVRQVAHRALHLGSKRLSYGLIPYLRSRVLVVLDSTAFEDILVMQSLYAAVMGVIYSGQRMHIMSTTKLPDKVLSELPPTVNFGSLEERRTATLYQSCVLFRTRGLTVSRLVGYGIYAPHISTLHVDSIESFEVAMVKVIEHSHQ
jgi:hypothetical protein